MFPVVGKKMTPIVRDEVPAHLTEEEVNRLVRAYQEWFDARPGVYRAKYWAIFLLLRFTGARVSEVLALDDTRDLDFRRSEVVLPTLKRKSRTRRTVPLPKNVIAEIGRLLAEFPELRGKLFRADRTRVWRVFRERCQAAGIRKELSHPHVLRHTRAIELLRTGVPVTAVQQILGHANIGTTAIYLRFTGREIRQVMEDRGLI